VVGCVTLRQGIRAAMSVAGFDVGNATSCVALARKRGIDVLMNAESKRETPAVVSFGDKMRFIGVEGAAKLTMNVKNTVTQVKRLIGRKFSDPDVQEDIKDFMFKVVEGPDGNCLFEVTFLNEKRQFTPEQVMTCLLKDLKKIAENDQGSAITDCVVSVPVYFAEAERLAMLNSAALAGLKCLRLMNEPTATALNWGIFKSDLPEDKPINVAFVDVGHSSLQVCSRRIDLSTACLTARRAHRALAAPRHGNSHDIDKQ
jgi:heat shock 70kDa protein 4